MTFDEAFKSILGKPKVSEKANNDCLLKGRITRPTIGLSDPEFVYRDSLHTDITETWNKARKVQKQ